MKLELPQNFKITPEFQQAVDLLEFPNKHVFVSGKAGTGKSTFLTYLQQHFEKRNFAVVAPTGVAALNVGGQTIHSFFKIKPGLFDPEEVGPRRNRRLYEKLDLLIIDEISMVRADLLDMIDLFLKNNGPKKGRPFGGVQLCFIGDIGQLPPVVSRDEREIFYQMYADRDFFHANALKKLDITTIQFQEIFRQTDADFIRLLNRVRNRENSQELLEILNSRCTLPPKEKEYVTLTTRTIDADQLNRQKLANIETPAKTYIAKIIGDAKTFAHKTPAPE
ncbi:MAG: AAA family ATPase, partial [Alphaproteobacteria bacterium]|nr:AAA family ATPase [Alphaproteobacteria bacterium]